MKVRKTMSQEYRMPEGGQESYGKRLWHLWSPLILKMAIGFGVSVLAAGAFSIIFMAKNPDLVNQATMDQSKISDLYQQLMGEILQVTGRGGGPCDYPCASCDVPQGPAAGADGRHRAQ